MARDGQGIDLATGRQFFGAPKIHPISQEIRNVLVHA